MTKAEAIVWAGGVNQLARRLGIRSQSISGWGVYPPLLRQYQIAAESKGELAVDRPIESRADAESVAVN